MQKKTKEDLRQYMNSHGMETELIDLPSEVKTVLQAAEAVGADEGQIAKSLLFLAEDRPVLVIALGSGRVDTALIASYFGIKPGGLKLASPDKALEVTGYTVGAVPPFGHRHDIETLIDQRMKEITVVYAGGGSRSTLIRMDPEVLIEHSQGRLVDLESSSMGGK
ncbi:MAG: YbaK/EbsC family protein [Anaerolineales bacterium]